MARQKPDDDEVHEEMLRHLQDHPPPRPQAREPKPASAPPARPTPPPIPHLNLRRMRLEPALAQLARFVAQHRGRATPEILVVVGRGHGSPGGEPVIGPAVRDWCARRSDLVV